MWGPVFANMFDGSMYGAGSHVFSVWTFCVSHGYEGSGVVRLNPKLLASVIGSTEEEMVEAIEYLCAPDEDSRSTDAGGARLLHLSGHEYGIVNWDHYQDIIRKEKKRAADRERMRRRRAADKSSISNGVADVAKSRKPSQKVAHNRIGEDRIGEDKREEGGETSPVRPGGTGPESRKEKSRTLFLPPSLDDVREYIAEKRYHFDAESFVAFYESKGWKVGKNPMKNWKAACTTWERRWKQENPSSESNLEKTFINLAKSFDCLPSDIEGFWEANNTTPSSAEEIYAWLKGN